MKWRQWVGFGTLCLWASLGWLAGDLLPVGMSSLAGAGLRLLLLGLGGAAVYLKERRWVGWRRVGEVAGVGLALVGGPALLLNLARGRASASLGLLLFALVPVGIVIVEGAMELLGWGLAGVAGVLLLLPVALPENGRGLAGIGLQAGAAGLTAAGLFGMRRLGPAIGLAGAVGAIGLGSGLVLLVFGIGGGAGWRWDALGAEVVRAVLVDLPEVVLLVWLARQVSPLRVSARYLMSPLLTVMEGWFVVREGIGLRMVLGIALLAGGAFGLLRGEIGRKEAER